VLFEGPVDLLHVPTWPAPAKILVDPGSFADKLRALDRPIASYLGEILHLWSTEYGAPETRKELWDLACVAAVADPESVTVGPQALATLDASGAHDFTQRGRVVNVVSDLDERHGSWRPHGSPKKSSILIDPPRSRNNPRPAARVRTKSGRMSSPRWLPPSPAGPPNAVDSRLRGNDGCGGLPRARVPNAISRKRTRHHPEDLKPDAYDIASAMMRS
jgi:hypothetical protein